MQSLQLTILLLSLIPACIAAPLTPLPDQDSTTEEDDDLQTYDYVYDPSEEEQADGDQNLELSQRLSGPSAAIPRHYLLNMATGQFAAITKSGRVNGNAQIGRLVAQFVLFRTQIDGREHLSLRSVRYEDRGWYLTILSNGKVRGSVPSNDNEKFEVVSLHGSTFALKLRRTRDEGSGNTSNTEDCFLGFAIADGRPSCYNSTEQVETHHLLVDVTL